MTFGKTKIMLFEEEWPEGKLFSPAEFFGRNAPVEIEIGCGKGKFLVDRAQESLDTDFIGIDRVAKWMKAGDRRSTKRQLLNLLFIKAEIRDFLKCIAPASIDVFHMYFPDPWPKRRHHPRRVFTADFLRLLHEKLKPAGLIEIATDDSAYVLQMQKSVEQSEIGWKKRKESAARLCHPHLKTNYELKFETEGRKLFYMELQKS